MTSFARLARSHVHNCCWQLRSGRDCEVSAELRDYWRRLQKDHLLPPSGDDYRHSLLRHRSVRADAEKKRGVGQSVHGEAKAIAPAYHAPKS